MKRRHLFYIALIQRVDYFKEYIHVLIITRDWCQQRED